MSLYVLLCRTEEITHLPYFLVKMKWGNICKVPQQYTAYSKHLVNSAFIVMLWPLVSKLEICHGARREESLLNLVKGLDICDLRNGFISVQRAAASFLGSYGVRGRGERWKSKPLTFQVWHWKKEKKYSALQREQWHQVKWRFFKTAETFVHI